VVPLGLDSDTLLVKTSLFKGMPHTYVQEEGGIPKVVPPLLYFGISAAGSAPGAFRPGCLKSCEKVKKTDDPRDHPETPKGAPKSRKSHQVASLSRFGSDFV
jgi:hypothetical protein